MAKRLLTLFFTLLFALSLSTVAFAKDAGKEARWEGTVIRSNPDKSTLTVRDKSHVEMIVQYDSWTRWVSQYHCSTKVNDIDASQVKDGDRVICEGTREKEGTFHATLISKRLSH